jgi:hypothetical protein
VLWRRQRSAMNCSSSRVNTCGAIDAQG